MKKIKIIFSLIFFAALFLFSCNDEFLERYPLDEISNETFWNTEADLKVYNNRLYHLTYLNDQINVCHRGNTITRMTKSNWADTHAASDYSNFRWYVWRRSGKMPPQTTGRPGGWKDWGLVREINVGLQNYHKADLPERVINQYAAEARFFRAWFYSDKSQLFGDVPWIGKPLNIDSEELFGPRMPREQAMDSVLADINFAVEHLPEHWPDAASPSTSSRFNQWHALLLKSWICLFEGTHRKYHGGTNPDFWLQEAANAAKHVIDYGPYQIYSTGDSLNDYREMFANETTIKLWNNPEVMYWREYIAGERSTSNHMMQTYWHHYGGGTKSLVDDYLMIDGKPPITTEGVNPLYMGDDEIEDVFTNRDPRMRQTLLQPADVERYRHFQHMPHPQFVGTAAWKKTTTGYHTIKFFNREMIDRTWGEIDQPAVIMRYAEVLLNYVEARAELGVITQEDLDITINKLRDRVKMPHLKLDDVPVDPRYTDVSPIIAEIRRERKIELAFEGFRIYDLFRWKWGHLLRNPDMGLRFDDRARERYPEATVQSSIIKDPITGEMKEYVDIYKGTQYADPVFEDDKHYLFSLPLNDLSENPNLKQNPGWEF
jgi:hypothetical protein